MKDNTHFKDTSKIRAELYHEVAAKNTRQCTRCGNIHEKKKKKRKTATVLRSVEGATAYTILRTIVSQRHTYDKGETIALREKTKLVQSQEKKPTQI